ncbi:MAG: hypothetical protein ACRDQU_16955 [Pseudonocardiaceae bacterium]
MEVDLYDGVTVDRLPIDAADVPDPAHLRRSDRYRGAVDIEPEHAIEAVFDPRRLVARDPKSRTGEAIRVIGYSAGDGPGSGRGAGARWPSTERVVACRYGMAGG